MRTGVVDAKDAYIDPQSAGVVEAQIAIERICKIACVAGRRSGLGHGARVIEHAIVENVIAIKAPERAGFVFNCRTACQNSPSIPAHGAAIHKNARKIVVVARGDREFYARRC